MFLFSFEAISCQIETFIFTRTLDISDPQQVVNPVVRPMEENVVVEGDSYEFGLHFIYFLVLKPVHA